MPVDQSHRTTLRRGTRIGSKRSVALLGCLALTAALALAPSAPAGAHQRGVTRSAHSQLIPKPVHETAGHGHFTLTRHTRIVAPGAAGAVGRDLARALRPATGYPLHVRGGHARRGDIRLRLTRSAAIAGDRVGEGYRLAVTPHGVVLRAVHAHGLFNGIETIRQLLPPWIASHTHRRGPWTISSTHITDFPRYGYRGFMLDIARHYQPPAVVKRLIDEAAQYKFNVFHLHLSDDQGFRVVMHGFPRLTKIGGRGSVGTEGRTRDPGGFWTQAQYRSVLRYAAARFMTVVPEVDTPGHNNAIIMSEYRDTANPRLNGHPHDINCSTNHPPKWNYTGDVGYSALCPASKNTWTLLRAIIGQLTRLSPGRYYDLGGDEVPTTVLSQQRYAALVNKEARIVAGDGKAVMGWADISSAGTNPPKGSVAEYWNPASGSADGTQTGRDAVAKGMKVVMAPANHTYLDQRYATHVPTDLGQTWACEHGCDVDQFYNWDPAHYVNGVSGHDVIGVEGALWTETLRTRSVDEYMIFPRLLALAEVAWSPRVPRTAHSPAYAQFLTRLAGEGPRLQAAGINFYPTPEVPWHLALVAGTPHESAGGQRVGGVLAALSAPGRAHATVHAIVHWGSGATSAARVVGAGPGNDRVNGVYRIRAAHTYPGTVPRAVTVHVTSPGMAATSVRVPLRHQTGTDKSVYWSRPLRF
jgi:hexosaminidase